MRAYLDTNILVYYLLRRDELGDDVREILFDYESILYTSTVCVAELLHLIQIGKVRIPGRKDIREAARTTLQNLEETGISVVPTNNSHLRALIDLPLYDDHRDPNDRLIVAQAIADRIPLISSDHKFTKYERYGLEFIYNER